MRILFFAAIALFFTTTGFSQPVRESSASNAVFGIQGGLNISNMKAKMDGASAMGSGIIGVNVGGFVEMPYRHGFSFRTELAFAMAGLKESNNEKLTIAYVNLPILVKYNVSNSGLSVYAGPQAGIYAFAKGKSGGTTVDIKSGIKEVDLSGVFGASFQPGNSQIIISARYQLGFTNVVENLPDGMSMKHRIATFMIGYLF